MKWRSRHCVGYTLGWLLGSLIEEKLALGTSDVQIIIANKDFVAVEKYLTENNYGYFVSDCRGKNGIRHKIDVILPRKTARVIRKELAKLCKEKVFIANYDVPYTKGGYGVKSKK